MLSSNVAQELMLHDRFLLNVQDMFFELPTSVTIIWRVWRDKHKSTISEACIIAVMRLANKNENDKFDGSLVKFGAKARLPSNATRGSNGSDPVWSDPNRIQLRPFDLWTRMKVRHVLRRIASFKPIR